MKKISLEVRQKKFALCKKTEREICGGGLPLVAEAGLEPTTFGLWARRATKLLHSAIFTFPKYFIIITLYPLFVKLKIYFIGILSVYTKKH